MMKIRWKHIVSFALALAFCLSLAACGNSDDVGYEFTLLDHDTLRWGDFEFYQKMA